MSHRLTRRTWAALGILLVAIPALMAVDEFEVVDRKILSELVREVAARTVAAQELEGWVLQRRRGHWF